MERPASVTVAQLGIGNQGQAASVSDLSLLNRHCCVSVSDGCLVCAQIDGCDTEETCTSDTNSRCGRCVFGYYLSKGLLQDTCVCMLAFGCKEYLINIIVCKDPKDPSAPCATFVYCNGITTPICTSCPLGFYDKDPTELVSCAGKFSYCNRH
jgi:hypothetical protein